MVKDVVVVMGKSNKFEGAFVIGSEVLRGHPSNCWSFFHYNTTQESHITSYSLFPREHIGIVGFMELYLIAMPFARIIIHPSWSSSNGISSKKTSMII